MAGRARDISHFLPLSPPMLHALLSLADGEKHGYAIIKEIERRTGGEVRLGAGTLYTLIKRALGDGLVAESDDRPDPSLDDERRRYYRLTPLGRSVAEADIARLEGLVQMARAKNLRTRRA
jgi:DNA-binding PadR family transcriptional regulator